VSIRSGRYVVLAAALTFAGALAAAVPVRADTNPQVTVVGGAAVPTRAPSTDEVTYTISIGDASARQVVLNAFQPDGLTASPSSVMVDGAHASHTKVDQSGTGLSVRLGSGADRSHGGTLGVGNHTVTFHFHVASLPTGSAAAYAVVDYRTGSQTRHARSPQIPLAMPDLTVTEPSGSGESRVVPLGTGVDADFQAILSNMGGIASAAALTMTLPVGMRIDRSFGIYRDDEYRSAVDTGGVKLRCATVASHVVRCALGAVPTGTSALLDIPVQPTSKAPVGQTGTFAVTALANNRLEANRDDNTVHGSVQFTGAAHLVVSVMPHPLRATVGHASRLVVAIHNSGPDPAVRALALVEVRSAHFTIVRFSGKQQPPPSAGASPRWGSRWTSGTAAALASAGKPSVVWKIGSIPSGRTVRAVVRLHARSAGQDELLVAAGSSAGDPPCEGVTPTPQCKSFVFAKLIARKPHGSDAHASMPARRG
jgi:hypothetical protein